jgi:hypothetical protein
MVDYVLNLSGGILFFVCALFSFALIFKKSTRVVGVCYFIGWTLVAADTLHVFPFNTGTSPAVVSRLQLLGLVSLVIGTVILSQGDSEIEFYFRKLGKR